MPNSDPLIHCCILSGSMGDKSGTVFSTITHLGQGSFSTAMPSASMIRSIVSMQSHGFRCHFTQNRHNLHRLYCDHLHTQHTKSPKGLTNHWTEVDWTGQDSRKCQKYVNQPPEAKLSICTRRIADNNRSDHNGIGLMGCCVNPCCHSGLASVTGRE